eukprot:2170497-Rhodomonas_salina.2
MSWYRHALSTNVPVQKRAQCTKPVPVSRHRNPHGMTKPGTEQCSVHLPRTHVPFPAHVEHTGGLAPRGFEHRDHDRGFLAGFVLSVEVEGEQHHS